MSRKRNPPVSRFGRPLRARNGKWSVSEDGFDFLRGRDPEVMLCLLRQIRPRRAVLSWLTPEKPLFGLPYHWDGLPWLTIVDDLDPPAVGPDSFDGYSLEWWATRAGPIAIDAATPTVVILRAAGSSGGSGTLRAHRPDRRRTSAPLAPILCVRSSARHANDDDALSQKLTAQWAKASCPNRRITRRFRIGPTYLNHFGHAFMLPVIISATPRTKSS